MTFKDIGMDSLWRERRQPSRLVRVHGIPRSAGAFVFYRRVSYPFQRLYPECAITTSQFLQRFDPAQAVDAVDPALTSSVDPSTREKGSL